jgi:hypothetical protein
MEFLHLTQDGIIFSGQEVVQSFVVPIIPPLLKEVERHEIGVEVRTKCDLFQTQNSLASVRPRDLQIYISITEDRHF